MKILFDLTAVQPAGATIYHGGAEYAKSVFFELVKECDNCTDSIAVFYNPQIAMPQEILSVLKEKAIRLFFISTSVELRSLLAQHSFQTVYSALPELFRDVSVHGRFIFTIHGLRFFESPTDMYEPLYFRHPKEWIKYIYKKNFPTRYESRLLIGYQNLFANENIEIIVPSNHTKYNLLCYFPELKGKNVRVYYSPAKENNSRLKTESEVLINEPFFLILSGSIWYKNPFRALVALDRIYSKYKDVNYSTVVLGSSKLIQERLYKKRLKNLDRFFFYDYVSTETLDVLYRKSACLIYPSLSEGFGYPPIECMKYGRPVLASSISSIPEICGSAPVYFNPFSISEIENRILQFIFEYDHTELEFNSKQQYELVNKKQKDDLGKLVHLILS